MAHTARRRKLLSDHESPISLTGIWAAILHLPVRSAWGVVAGVVIGLGAGSLIVMFTSQDADVVGRATQFFLGAVAAGVLLIVEVLLTNRSDRRSVQVTLTSAEKLNWADVSGHDISKVYLRERKMKNAKLSECLALQTDFFGTDLRKARLTRGVFIRCNFAEADLSKIAAYEAKFRKSCLTGAKMKKANLRHANLRKADLTNADLRGALLHGANLRGATTDGADFSGALFDSRTKFPTRLGGKPAGVLEDATYKPRGLQSVGQPSVKRSWFIGATLIGGVGAVACTALWLNPQVAKEEVATPESPPMTVIVQNQNDVNVPDDAINVQVTGSETGDLNPGASSTTVPTTTSTVTTLPPPETTSPPAPTTAPLRSVDVAVEPSVPAAPTEPIAEPRDGGLRIAWTPGVADEQNAATLYVATASPGNHQCAVQALRRSCEFKGLENGRKYAVAVVAQNAEGTSKPVETVGTPAAPPTRIVVRAKGDQTSERFDVRVGGELVGTATAKTGTYRKYRFDAPPELSGPLTVEYVNDFSDGNSYDRTLWVDKVFVDGVGYESEDGETFASGVWSSGSCIEGFALGEKLSCSGKFSYTIIPAR